MLRIGISMIRSSATVYRCFEGRSGCIRRSPSPRRPGSHQRFRVARPFITEPVKDVAAPLLAGDQSTVMQAAQVVGGVRLAQAGDRDDLADTERARAEGFEDGKPGGIEESAEELGLQVERARRRGDQHVLAFVSS